MFGQSMYYVYVLRGLARDRRSIGRSAERVRGEGEINDLVENRMSVMPKGGRTEFQVLARLASPLRPPHLAHADQLRRVVLYAAPASVLALTHQLAVAPARSALG
jgi:hypothetical protein